MSFTKYQRVVFRKEDYTVYTINDIAREANVSKATVSRVINNRPGVSPDNRRRILELIQKNHFQPNAFARAVSERTSHFVGLVFPYNEKYILSNPIYSEILRGLLTSLAQNGYFGLLCFNSTPDYITDLYRQGRIDAFIIISPSGKHLDIIEAVQSLNAPFVITCDYKQKDNPSTLCCIDTDNFSASMDAMEYLIEHGHKEIAHLTIHTESSRSVFYEPFIVREDAYMKALKAHNITQESECIRQR